MRIATEFSGGSPAAILVDLPTIKTRALREDLARLGRMERGRLLIGWDRWRALLKKHGGTK